MFKVADLFYMTSMLKKPEIPTSNHPIFYALHILTDLLKWIECDVLAQELQRCKEAAVKKSIDIF